MNNRPKKIILLSDVDGTLTDIPGAKLLFIKNAAGKSVLTDFYRSLLIDPSLGYTSQLKPHEEVLAIMDAQFKTYELQNGKRDPRRISEEAVKFLKVVLNSDEIGLAFISRNNAAYIMALLTYEGFDEKEINNSFIYAFTDVKTANIHKSGGKRYDAKMYLKGQTPDAVFIFDDSSTDATAMVEGVDSDYMGEIIKYNVEPGKFDWPTYLNQIQQKLHPVTMSPTFFNKNKENDIQTNDAEKLATLDAEKPINQP